jgi:hypothetical protein
MRQLEIIHLRSSGELVESLGDRISESINAAGGDIKVVTLYRRKGLETDIAIHIHHLEVSETEGPSSLGQRLTSELRAFGLVEHALWEELR